MLKTTKKQNQKPCPPGKIRNPKTGRCINDPQKKNTGTKKAPAKKTLILKKHTKPATKKPCPPGKIRNPKQVDVLMTHL